MMFSRWAPKQSGGPTVAQPYDESIEGWIPPMQPRGHYCYPPQVYPSGATAGSQYACGCGNVWLAVGVRMVGEYPIGNRPESGVLLGPKCYALVHGTAKEGEAGLYDWRTDGEAIIAVLSTLVRNGVLK